MIPLKRVTTLLLGAVAGVVLSSLPAWGQAQQSQQHPATHTASPPAETKDLQDQIADLRAQVAKLQAALQQTTQRKSASTSGTQMKQGGTVGMPMQGMQMGMMGREMGRMGMGSMGSMPSGSSGMPAMGGGMMGEMGGMEGMEGMAAMPSGTMPGMEMSGMDMMGRMRGSGGMRMPSALPGVAGASHLYHVGSTGFFLDHPEHVTLRTDQQTQLNRIKEKVLLDQANTQRRVEQAEQELWTLTGSDQPDAAGIQAKLAEIEKLRTEQRLAFIRSVGEAATVLTVEQRQALLGTARAKASK
ncbi:MAG: hypothetical protein LC130_12580 [Bryobacterales bacterium]|nr:hypothetical protein [Bryobacterales bacterium]